MTKIMLVEDDKSLREIYGIRLVTEGYEIVSAGDGEEALAMAVKERPDLILSDVMMPKISGFDMLDILRATPETKDIKVVMMTALSSEDQRARGEALGADRYLVKSQVGIEDVVKTVHDVLNNISADPEPTPTQETASSDTTTETEPTSTQFQSVASPEPLPPKLPVITSDMVPVHEQVVPTPHSEPSVFKDRTMEPVTSTISVPGIDELLRREPVDDVPPPPPTPLTPNFSEPIPEPPTSSQF